MKNLRPAITLVVFFTLFFGFLYEAAVTEVAELAFPKQAYGSLLKVGDKVIGSEILGQNFTDPKYFWGRLSATTPMPYNAANSMGSNLGPSNPDLVKAAQARMDELNKYKGRSPVPVDLVTASASGLDPEISVAAADYQVERVAKQRHLQEAQVIDLVKKYTSDRQFGIFGEPRVNVLKLNLALDGKI